MSFTLTLNFRTDSLQGGIRTLIFLKSLIRCTISENVDSEEFSMNVIDGIKDKLLDTKAKVMILDNLSFLSTQTSEAEYAGAIMDGLTRLKREMCISIMVIAHTPKIEEWKPLSKTNMAGARFFQTLRTGVASAGQRQVKVLETSEDTYGERAGREVFAAIF